MNNRLLSLLIILVIFSGLWGIYYYFFVANAGNVSFVINSSGSTQVELISEFRNSYNADCEKLCTFKGIPPVTYLVRAKKDGYVTLEKTFALKRGDTKKIVLIMEKKVTLTERAQKKEETISALKLKKSISDIIASHTGSVVLGYRTEWLYFAIPTDTGWMVSRTDEKWEKALFPLPEGSLSEKSLDIYEGYLALDQSGQFLFANLWNGAVTIFDFNGPIIWVQDTGNRDTKIITSSSGAFTYSVADKNAQENPLYDDIIPLPSGKIVVLVRKTSVNKLSLLGLPSGRDYIILIGSDTRERKILLSTEKNGTRLQYRNKEIVFTDDLWENFVVQNVE